MSLPPFSLPQKKTGLMIVLSSPSGAGKTTIAKGLLKNIPDLKLSVSATTRQKRSLEKEGEDYFFLSEKEFQQKICNNDFVEYAKIFHHYYGTPKSFVQENIKKGQDVLFDVDWQGAQALCKHFKKFLVRIFILPPSIDALYERLKARGQDSDENIAVRMDKAYHEMLHWKEYDYVIINHEIIPSINQAMAIIQAEQLKINRYLA